MSTRPRLTPEEYLAIERGAERKSEYVNGEMFALSEVYAKVALDAGDGGSVPPGSTG